MHIDDVRHTAGGTWYFDIAASTDEDDAPAAKTLKTRSSRRRVPIQPELIALGFLQFVEDRRAAAEARLFSIKPDAYGNFATCPLKRFRDEFLPRAIALMPRPSFYSFRHSFRDALRRIGAPPDALQALGGWSQGKLVSDNYGDKSEPDYQARYIRQIAFSGLDLSCLHVEQLK